MEKIPENSKEDKSVDVEKSIFDIRRHRDLERGTELTYVTIPISEFNIDSLTFQKEAKKILDELYGGNRVTFGEWDYDNIVSRDVSNEQINNDIKKGFKEFINDSTQEEIIVKLNELDENGLILKKFAKSKIDLTFDYQLEENKMKEMWGPEWRSKYENLVIENNKKTKLGGYYEQFLRVKKVGKRLMISTCPVVHTITKGYAGEGVKGMMSEDEGTHLTDTDVGDLMSILNNGFVSPPGALEYYDSTREGNSVLKRNKNHKANFFPHGESSDTETINLEIFPSYPSSEKSHVSIRDGKINPTVVKDHKDYLIGKAKPDQISAVNILFDSKASQEDIRKKMNFYQKEISDKYHIPVRFYVSENGKFLKRISEGNY